MGPRANRRNRGVTLDLGRKSGQSAEAGRGTPVPARWGHAAPFGPILGYSPMSLRVAPQCRASESPRGTSVFSSLLELKIQPWSSFIPHVVLFFVFLIVVVVAVLSFFFFFLRNASRICVSSLLRGAISISFRFYCTCCQSEGHSTRVYGAPTARVLVQLGNPEGDTHPGTRGDKDRPDGCPVCSEG